MTRVPTAYIALNDHGPVVLGRVLMPLRTLGWLRRYRRCRTFYDQGAAYPAWLSRPMRELVAFLRIVPTES